MLTKIMQDRRDAIYPPIDQNPILLYSHDLLLFIQLPLMLSKSATLPPPTQTAGNTSQNVLPLILWEAEEVGDCGKRKWGNLRDNEKNKLQRFTSKYILEYIINITNW